MLAALELHDEIGAVLFHHAFEDVNNLKPKMIVLDPGIDISIAVKLKRLRIFPSAVVNTEVNMRPFRSFAGPGCMPRFPCRPWIVLASRYQRQVELILYSRNESVPTHAAQPCSC